jgi:tRNA(Ile2) C34 agmatinyltransferase TiaS
VNPVLTAEPQGLGLDARGARSANGATLEQRLTAALAELRVGGSAVCPVCTGTMHGQGGSASCADCGSSLS